jgi:hypothetical protein
MTVQHPKPWPLPATGPIIDLDEWATTVVDG